MKALSLFSGIGGIDLAGEWVGIETVAFCEREPFCQKVLQKHWPDTPIYDDVCTLTKERLDADGIGTIELIHGGYPCQPFSNAGNRKGTEDDRHLWPEVFRLIQTLNPRWFVGENVAGHVTLGLDIVLADLESIGYAWEAFVIPASAVDARHRRDRIFIVAHPKSLDTRGLSIRTKEAHTGFTLSRENVSYTMLKRLQRSAEAGDSRSGWKNRIEQFTGCDTSRSTWTTEPDVGRVANGVPNRVDRLKALGNAVVPQQIYPILAAIKQIDDMIKEVTP